MDAQVAGALHEVFFLDDLNMGVRGGAGGRMAGKGVNVVESCPGLSNGFSDLLGCNRGADGQIAPGETLGDGHNVRGNAPVLTGEHPSGAAEAGLDFVEDEQDAVPVAQFTHALEVSVGRKWESRVGTGDGVHDDGGDGSGPLPLQDGCQILVAGQCTRIGVQAEFTAITVRRHGVGETRQQGFVGLASPCQAGCGERAERCPVV